MSKMLKAALALSALLIAAPAHSAVIITSHDQNALAPLAQMAPTSVNNPLLFDWNVTTSDGNHRSAWEFTACEDICQYNSVRGGGIATYAFAQNQQSLNMMWGSPDKPPPDDYNVLEFFDNGVSQGIFNGSQIATMLALFPIPNNQTGKGFLRITFSGIFDSVVFTAGQTAFEHVFNFRGSATEEVPLPAGLLLLFSGLAGLGFMARSRAKTA